MKATGVTGSRVAERNGEELEDLRNAVATLESKIARAEELLRQPSERRWCADDSAFLIYVLGFAAGAHMERPGETATQIYSRARDLMIKVLGQEQPHGGNGS